MKKKRFLKNCPNDHFTIIKGQNDPLGETTPRAGDKSKLNNKKYTNRYKIKAIQTTRFELENITFSNYFV